MLDPFSESLEKKEYAIEKILASLLFELFDFEFQIWTCTVLQLMNRSKALNSTFLQTLCILIIEVINGDKTFMHLFAYFKKSLKNTLIFLGI